MADGQERQAVQLPVQVLREVALLLRDLTSAVNRCNEIWIKHRKTHKIQVVIISVCEKMLWIKHLRRVG
jgi:hypothetical protein